MARAESRWTGEATAGETKGLLREVNGLIVVGYELEAGRLDIGNLARRAFCWKGWSGAMSAPFCEGVEWIWRVFFCTSLLFYYYHDAGI